jgi:hypothetical protein
MENETKKLPDLKMPLIGDVNIYPMGIIYKDNGDKGVIKPVIKPVGINDLIDFEKAIGSHLFTSGEYEKLLDLLFPEVDKFTKDKVYSIVYEQRTEDVPLIFKIFGPPDTNGDVDLPRRSSWANLMLDLGEFNLDKENRGFEKVLPFIYGSHAVAGEKVEPQAIYARFESPGKILGEIWQRILGTDTVVVFIEDDPDFEEYFQLENCSIEIPQDISVGKKYWINGKDYNETTIKKTIKKIIESFKKIEDKKKKLVFIVDLLYKEGKEVNEVTKIKGTGLIQYIQGEIEEPSLVIGFTGGKSPFIINSATKVGADVVIMKARSNSFHGASHPSPSAETVASNRIDSSGLFDLLWALSKNISRMRFLEAIRNSIPEHIGEQRFDYRPVLKSLFFSIADESPFWRKYLQDWEKQIDDILIESVFAS